MFSAKARKKRTARRIRIYVDAAAGFASATQHDMTIFQTVQGFIYMKILMHICCGPCTIYPLKELRTQGHEITGVFYNPNIHPYQEYQKRRQTLSD